MLPLPVLLLVLGAAWNALRRALRYHSPRSDQHLDEGVHLRVLITVTASDDWNGLLWHCIRTAAVPRRVCFGVLVECEGLDEIDSELDPLLQTVARIDHCLAPRDRHDVARRTRRLTRRFVVGDETLVILVDPRATLRPRWDAHLLAVAGDSGKALGDGDILSVPARCTPAGDACFPCLRVRDGEVRRRGALPFRLSDACLVPSVCWCPELTVARPVALRGWPAGRGILAQEGRTLWTTTVALLDDAPVLEQDYADSPHGGRPATLADVPRCLGLVEVGDERESLLKFGSSRAGPLAVRLGYDAVHRKSGYKNTSGPLPRSVEP